MPAKHIILVHGRDIKPAAGTLASLAKRAIVGGLQRAGEAAKAAQVSSGSVKFSSAYFGDINNRIESENDADTLALLTASNDPQYAFRPCFPVQPLEEGFQRTDALPAFTRAAYRRVLEISDDWRFLDEAASAASLFGSLLTFGLLNEFLISTVKSDLTQYLTSQVTGSDVRRRLQDVLEPAIAAGDDICLVTHSLGCMVAYDVFWKYSFRGEYGHMQNPANPVKLWITMGCPLGEPGVKRNLLDAMALPAEKHPRNQFVDWVNIHAEDDFIAHAESMRSAYSKMTSQGWCNSIRDKKIWNCWHYTKLPSGDIASNPHDMYGYLMNQETGKFIAGWM